MVNLLSQLTGRFARCPGQRPESVRGDHMTITPALLCRRAIRPRRTVRNPWAFHPQVFDLRVFDLRAFDLRAPDLPWPG